MLFPEPSNEIYSYIIVCVIATKYTRCSRSGSEKSLTINFHSSNKVPSSHLKVRR